MVLITYAQMSYVFLRVMADLVVSCPSLQQVSPYEAGRRETFSTSDANLNLLSFESALNITINMNINNENGEQSDKNINIQANIKNYQDKLPLNNFYLPEVTNKFQSKIHHFFQNLLALPPLDVAMRQAQTFLFSQAAICINLQQISQYIRYMKIILKNSATNHRSLFKPLQADNFRYGELITFVRELEGNFNFLLAYKPSKQQTPIIINSQQDLDKVVEIEKKSQYIQISIEKSELLPDKSFQQCMINEERASRTRSNSNFLFDGSQQLKSERSQVGKFRKIKKPKPRETSKSDGKESDFLKSQVTEIVEQELPNIMKMVSKHLSQKKSSLTDFRQNQQKSMPKLSSVKSTPKTQKFPFHQDYFINGNPDKCNGNSFKISDVRTVNTNVQTHYQSMSYLDPYQFYEQNKKGLQPFKNVQSPANYRYSYGDSEYNDGENIFVQIVTRKKSVYSKKKEVHKKVCDCQSNHYGCWCLKKGKKTESKEYCEKKKKQKQKEKLIQEKTEKICKKLSLKKKDVRSWVQKYFYLETIEIIQKMIENQRKKQNRQLNNMQYSSASEKQLAYSVKKGPKVHNLMHRKQRIESETFDNHLYSDSRDSFLSQKRKLSVKSISNALPTKTIRQKGAIFLKMKEMFGQQKRSQIFNYIEANEHLSQECIIDGWIRKSYEQP